MKSYEKTLKQIIEISAKIGSKTISNLEGQPGFALNTDDLEILDSLELIDMVRYVNSVDRLECRFTLQPKAALYFKEQRKERFRFYLPIVISNIIALAALILSIISILLSLK